MEHNDIQYTVVQTASPTGWKWTIEVDGRVKTGRSYDRATAIRQAEIAIERAQKGGMPIKEHRVLNSAYARSHMTGPERVLTTAKSFAVRRRFSDATLQPPQEGPDRPG